MKPFRERNPVPIGLVGTLVMLMFATLAFKASDLPVFNGGGTVYKADFVEAANIQKDREVRIAGVKAGKVLSVEIEGDHVVVSFRLKKDTQVGRLTRAQIKVKTLTGQEYLSLQPEGNGQLDNRTAIPITRTTSPFEVVPAFQGLASTIEGIDTTQLGRALDAVSGAFADTAPNVKSSLDGLSRLSRAIAARDDELQTLLAHARNVTGVLAGRDQELQQLIVDADQVLQVIAARKQVITDLLQNIIRLSNQLSGLVADNRAALAPALKNLKGVVDTLNQNSASLTRGIQVLAPFLREFSDTIGNGHWFDTFVANLGPFNGGIGFPQGGSNPAGALVGGGGGASGTTTPPTTGNGLPGVNLGGK
jgi:phospholipid/cholesterol/gamma-HCH transport system substrate-binding protein